MVVAHSVKYQYNTMILKLKKYNQECRFQRHDKLLGRRFDLLGVVVFFSAVLMPSATVFAHISVSEVLAKNSDGAVTAKGGTDLDWIELANDGDADVDVTGWYLSGNREKPKAKWKKIEGRAIVPAGGFLVVWADKDYQDFDAEEAFVRMGLSSNGEDLFLAPPETKMITDEMLFSFGSQIKDVSYGRTAVGTFAYFKTPTPGAANISEPFGPPSPKVVFSESHGFKTKAVEVAMWVDGNGLRGDTSSAVPVYYTTDGTEPTAANGICYDGTPIRIAQTTLLRASSPVANSVMPTVSTATYLFVDDILKQGAVPEGGFPTTNAVNGQVLEFGFNDRVVAAHRDEIAASLTNSIPVYSIVGNLADFFSVNCGIYVNPTSEGRDWERKMSVELFDPLERESGFQIDCGIRLRGAYSRRGEVPKHSFRLFFRSEYGASKLEYPLFGDEGSSVFDKIDLRTDQNGSWANERFAKCDFIHEVFCRDVQRDQGRPYTRSRYCHLFLNGQYWGLYQTQERDDADFAADYLGGAASDWDSVRTSMSNGRYVTTAADGSITAFDQLVSACNAGLTDVTYHKLMGENADGGENSAYPVYLDDKNLMDYMIGLYYEHDPDGPYSIWNGLPNNLHSLYNRNKRDGFVWLRHDGEHAMGVTKHYYNPANSSCLRWGAQTGTISRGQMTPTALHCRLADGSPQYRRKFAARLEKQCFLESGVLSASNSLVRYRARMEEVDGAIWAEAARWGRGEFDKETWSNACANCMNNFIAKRSDQLKRYYQSEGWYPKITAPTVELPETCVFGKSAKLSAAEGLIIYLTDDGSDPAESASARTIETYSIGEASVTLKARAYDRATDEWSLMTTVEIVVEEVSEEERKKVLEQFAAAVDPAVVENIMTLADAAEFVAWTERIGMTLTTALQQKHAYLSFALDFDGVVTDEAVERVSDDDLMIAEIGGSHVVRSGAEIVVRINGLQVGRRAKEKYLKPLFRVKGGSVLDEELKEANVEVVGVKPNGDGGVVLTVVPTKLSNSFFLRVAFLLAF